MYMIFTKYDTRTNIFLTYWQYGYLMLFFSIGNLQLDILNLLLNNKRDSN